MKLFAIPALMLPLLSSSFSMDRPLSFEEKVNQIGILTNSINFEDYIATSNQNWMTLENFTFSYKSSRSDMEYSDTFYLANGFDGKWGGHIQV